MYAEIGPQPTVYSGLGYSKILDTSKGDFQTLLFQHMLGFIFKKTWINDINACFKWQLLL